MRVRTPRNPPLHPLRQLQCVRRVPANAKAKDRQYQLADGKHHIQRGDPGIGLLALRFARVGGEGDDELTTDRNFSSTTTTLTFTPQAPKPRVSRPKSIHHPSPPPPVRPTHPSKRLESFPHRSGGPSITSTTPILHRITERLSICSQPRTTPQKHDLFSSSHTSHTAPSILATTTSSPMAATLHCILSVIQPMVDEA